MCGSDKNSIVSSSSTLYTCVDDDERQYMILIETHVQPYFPKFAAALKNQTPIERESGRCSIIDFGAGSDRNLTEFKNSTDVYGYLLESESPTFTSSFSPQPPPKRRLFILEDLPSNYIVALGSKLRIPPSFFARHWDDPASSSFNHRDIFKRSSRSHFLLRYATSNPITIDSPAHANTNMYAFDSNVCRYLHMYKKDGLVYDDPRSHHAMSFWSSSIQKDGSWDAVLLVDPPPTTYVKCVPSEERVSVRPYSSIDADMSAQLLNPEIDSLEELPSNPKQWTYDISTPSYRSMYDDTLKLLLSPSYLDRSITKPIDAVEAPRKLIISTLIAFLRRRYLNLLKVQKSQLRTNTTMRHNYLYSFSEGYMGRWHDECFNFIMGTCAAMREFSREVDDNITALSLRRSSYQKCKNSQAHNRNGSTVTMTGAAIEGNGRIPQWEVDGWKSVSELTSLVSTMIHTLADSYLQYISIQEARMSNMNAQSLSRITMVSMLFIPLSTVASIFSMGGEFLPGERRNWIFWIVALPMLVGLAWVYWQKTVIELWRKRKRAVLPVFEALKRRSGRSV